jgi:hypothetical protein
VWEGFVGLANFQVIANRTTMPALDSSVMKMVLFLRLSVTRNTRPARTKGLNVAPT